MSEKDVDIKIKIDASSAEKSTENFRQRVKELKDEMTRLQLAGKESSEEYSKLAQELGTIQDAMGDTAAQARNMSDDFLSFRAGLEGIGAGVASITAVKGAMSLFGIESEGVTETLTKLAGAMTILNSLQTVAKALNKDSALMTMLRAKAQKSLNTELAKTTTTETAGVGAMTAYTAGEAAATAGAGALKTGIRAVGTAIKSVPVIGWILAAIAALTTIISLISDANEEEEEGNRLRAKEQQALDDIHDKHQKILDEILQQNYALQLQLGTMSKLSKDSVEYQDLLKNLADYTGLSADYLETLTDAEKQQLAAVYGQMLQEEEHLKELNDLADQYQQKWDEAKKNQYSDDEDTRKKAIADLEWMANSSSDYYKKTHENEENIQKANDRIATSQKAINKERQKELDYKKKIADETEREKKAQENARKAAQDKAKAEREYQELVKNNLSEIEGLEKFIADETKKFNDETLEGKLANIDAEEIAITNLYDDALDKALKYYGAESEEVRKLNELRAQSLNSLETKRSDTVTEDENKKKEEEKKEEEEKKKAEQEGRDIELAKVKGRLAAAKENSEDFFKLKQEELRIETENEIAELQNRYDNGLISFELFEAEKFRISQEYLNQKEELEKESQKALNEEAINLYNERLDRMGELQNTFSNMVTALQDAELANAEGDEKKQVEIKKKYARMQFLSNIASIGINTAKGIVAAWASAMELAFPYNLVVGGMLTAMLAATGAAQVAKAHSEMNNVLKAEKGGLIKGKTHKSGGERVGDSNLEVENGEYIVNRRSTAAFMPLLEAVNAYNGTPAPRMNVNSGQQTSLTAIDQSVIKEIVKETVSGVASIPVTVLEHSISKAQRNVRTIETLAIL